MEQLPLFVGAPVALNLQAVHEPGFGWRLSVTMRRDGQSWDDAYRASYECLSTPELFEVITNESAHRLHAT